MKTGSSFIAITAEGAVDDARRQATSFARGSGSE